MKINKKYLLMTLLPFLCLSKVYASCTQEEINNFKKIEDEYKITYEFDKNTKTYTLYLNNPDINSYVYTINIENAGKTTVENNTIIIENVLSGDYTATVNSNNDTCFDDLKTITINLPKYNKYAEDPLCKGIEEFVLCQETYDKDIDYETFKSRVETYKKTKEKKETESNILNQNNQVEENKILKYIETNLELIITITIFTILVIISTILTIKSIRKSRRLE